MNDPDRPWQAFKALLMVASIAATATVLLWLVIR